MWRAIPVDRGRGDRDLWISAADFENRGYSNHTYSSFPSSETRKMPVSESGLVFVALIHFSILNEEGKAELDCHGKF